MPTTFSLLIRLTLVAALIVGTVYLLATYIEPSTETISVPVRLERLE